MNPNLYPLKFTPILKRKIWGGQKLKTLLNKTTNEKDIGESWEISDVEGDTSVVSNGQLKGKTLTEVLEIFKFYLIGRKNYNLFGNKFPLLIKFIDAKQDLSIQLHPNDELAKKRHNSFGKTEMWYVMQADDNANLIVGFNQKMNQKKYLKHLEEKTLTEVLNFEPVQTGDTYFIDVGRVHAIGSGVMLAEIQQTSDITYRVYDWDRVGENGNKRDLHNDLAIDAINFKMKNDFKINYKSKINRTNRMVRCNYFTTNFLHIHSTVSKQNTHDSFIIYICVEGEGEIITRTGTETIKKGETILLPSILQSYKITAKNVKLLEVYV